MVKTTLKLYKVDIQLEKVEKDFIHYLNNYAQNIKFLKKNNVLMTSNKKYFPSTISKYINNLLRHNNKNFYEYKEIPIIEYDTTNHGTYFYAITHWNLFLKHKLENKKLYSEEKVNTTTEKIMKELNTKYEERRQKNKEKRQNNKKNKLTQKEINIIEENRIIKQKAEMDEIFKNKIKKQNEIILKNKTQIDVFYSKDALKYFVIKDNIVTDILDEEHIIKIQKINKKSYSELTKNQKTDFLYLLKNNKSKYSHNEYELIKIVLEYI